MHPRAAEISEPAPNAILGSSRALKDSVGGVAVSFVFILMWTALVSLPTFSLEDADDAFFLEVAHLWTRGMPPYVAAFDVKGPGGFAALAVATWLLGPTLATLKAASILFSGVAGTALYTICARYDRPAAILCAALYPIFMIVSGDVVYQLMNAALLVAIAIALSGSNSVARSAAAGLAVGVACTIKQTCAIDALVVIYILYANEARSAERVRSIAAFLGSVAIAPFAFFADYALRGDSAIFLQDVVWTALHRYSAAPWASALYNLLDFTFPLSIVLGMACIAWTDFAKMRSRFPIHVVTVWLALELTLTMIQRAGCRVYIVPLIAPLLVISSIYASNIWRAQGRDRQYLMLTLFGIAAFCCAMLGHGATILKKMPAMDYEFLNQIKARIDDTHPEPDDRLLVLNGSAFPNIVTDLRPPTPVFHWPHIMCDFPGAGLQALAENLAAKPRYIVRENLDKRLSCETAPYVDAIELALKSNYVSVSKGGTRNSSYEIFEKK
jgi:hypothetical protein